MRGLVADIAIIGIVALSTFIFALFIGAVGSVFTHVDIVHNATIAAGYNGLATVFMALLGALFPYDEE
ncbi:hypothetical protein LAU42_09060 [Macrococcus armenti]|uniref:hypothetical protein n=1 Tax=Macrococcus armenti TaxID=2875764 RepID=UPI001CCF049A|nr:hypothetical protein [Macrococcus armenti]UBH21913.1 hypothetical protein LAU42_09060 [Macrococcus armenti]